MPSDQMKMIGYAVMSMSHPEMTPAVFPRREWAEEFSDNLNKNETAGRRLLTYFLGKPRSYYVQVVNIYNRPPTAAELKSTVPQ